MEINYKYIVNMKAIVSHNFAYLVRGNQFLYLFYGYIGADDTQ